jgi:hypothetical protein
MNDTLTPEEIQKQYDAAMDSVNLIESGKPSEWNDEEWADCVKRNVEHLKIMVEKDYWTDAHDLSPLKAAIKR